MYEEPESVKTQKDIVLGLPPRSEIPRMARHGVAIIEETWRLLRNRLEREGHPLRDVINMQQAFVAATYAASRSIVMEHADSQDISEAAQRIEAQR